MKHKFPKKVYMILVHALNLHGFYTWVNSIGGIEVYYGLTGHAGYIGKYNRLFVTGDIYRMEEALRFAVEKLRDADLEDYAEQLEEALEVTKDG